MFMEAFDAMQPRQIKPLLWNKWVSFPLILWFGHFTCHFPRCDNADWSPRTFPVLAQIVTMHASLQQPSACKLFILPQWNVQSDLCLHGFLYSIYYIKYMLCLLKQNKRSQFEQSLNNPPLWAEIWALLLHIFICNTMKLLFTGQIYAESIWIL